MLIHDYMIMYDIYNCNSNSNSNSNRNSNSNLPKADPKRGGSQRARCPSKTIGYINLDTYIYIYIYIYVYVYIHICIVYYFYVIL